jgi:nitrite reductase/ring-hydroxylating ferredoxin subunit
VVTSDPEGRVRVVGLAEVTVAGERRWHGKIVVEPGEPPLRVAVFPFGDALLAIPAPCPHEGVNLVHARRIDARTIECQDHGIRYDLVALSGGLTVLRDDTGLWIMLPEG